MLVQEAEEELNVRGEVFAYLPAPSCISARFAGDPLNPFFLCDVEALVRTRGPALWIHGHTHDSVDVKVGATRIVCNPFGYVRHEENASFRDDAEIEVLPL